MGIEIKLSDRELPITADFIDFIAHLLDGRPFEGQLWSDQQVGGSPLPQLRHPEQLQRDADRVMQDPRGRALILRIYDLFSALLTGNLAPLRELQSRFHFVSIVGTPRSGGTYLTAELCEALGYNSVAIPDVLAHDGFPKAGPFDLAPCRQQVDPHPADHG